MANITAPYRSLDIVTHVRDWFMTMLDDNQQFLGTIEDLYRAYYVAQDCSNLKYCLSYHEFTKVCARAYVMEVSGFCCVAW